METLEFSQQELRIILSVFNHATIKLGDALLMLPIAQKIQEKIKPEPEKQPVDGPVLTTEVPEIK